MTNSTTDIKSGLNLTIAPETLARMSAHDFDWQSRARHQHVGRLEATLVPDRHLETWRTSNIRALQARELQLASRPSTAQIATAQQRMSAKPIACDVELIFIDGFYVQELSKLNAATGVEFESFAQAQSRKSLKSRAGLEFKKSYETLNSEREDYFSELSFSTLEDAALISVREKTKIAKPIVCRYFSSGTSAAVAELSSPRSAIHLGAGCEVEIVEFFEVLTGLAVTNYTSEIYIETGARLSLLSFHKGSNGYDLQRRKISQARDSFCETYVLTDGGGELMRTETRADLLESGAELNLNGNFIVDEKNHVDFNVDVRHLAEHTTSSQLFKGIAGGESRAAFSGKIHIQKHAQKSNASQLSQNLVFGKRAVLDCKPELEIDADDVKATHGSTVGQVRDDQVFYLQSRGIEKNRAKALLAEAFAFAVVDKMTNSETRNLIRSQIGEGLKRFRMDQT